MAGYQMNFNQDFTSISVLSHTGFRLFSISSTNDKIDEIFAKDNENIRLVERLFNSSLVVLVTEQKPNCLKMLHFKKKQDICNCVYPSDILCVRMNRHRLIVCLAESIHIHDIRDMKILHSIVNIAPNELGLCTLSLNSQLAFPICSTSGELRIFNANKLQAGLTIKAHDSMLSALVFSPNGKLLATASERGTVIRVFCVRNGQRVQEFRRGVKRCVRIASLVFAASGDDFLCASSNTETVHIFKIDINAVEATEKKAVAGIQDNEEAEKLQTANAVTVAAGAATGATAATTTTKSSAGSEEKPKHPVEANAAKTPSTLTTTTTTNGSWTGYLTKAVSTYLMPTQVCDVLAQDRAFATAVISQPGLKHVCGLTRVQKELKLLIACEDGFLHVYDFSIERGGACKLLRVHDLRYALDGVVELNLTELMDKTMLSQTTLNMSASAVAECKNGTGEAHKSAAAASIRSSVLIENPEPAPDNSYAGILRGDQTTLTDSAKFRKLCDAIDTPNKLYDERQFPPVAIAAKD